MNITRANRMDAFGENVFSKLAQIKKTKISEGIDIIDLSIGSPDLPPPFFVQQTIAGASKKDNSYGYSLAGTKEFHHAVSRYYQDQFSAVLQPEEEILLLMGSQDGLVHLPMVICNPGDYILVPDPGYTAYAAGAALAGAEMYSMPLLPENGFLPDFSVIPAEIREKAKLMILNFPGNPVPAMATVEFFEEAIAFAKQNNIVILHDFAYSELYFEERPPSFLSVNGAMDVGIEMNSLSKSFHMAGCRVAYAAGNMKVLALLSQLKSNLDYGVFLPLQAAAAEALTKGSEFLDENRKIYKTRRNVLVNGLNELGWEVEAPKASMFIWAKIPSQFTSEQFAYTLLNNAGVVVTPGNAFGRWGEGYVRIALVQPEPILEKAVQNIANSGVFEIIQGR